MARQSDRAAADLWSGSRASSRSDDRLQSLSMAAPELDALSVLRASTQSQRAYWAAPAHDAGPAEELAGSGVAVELGTEPLLGALDGRAANRFAAIREQATTLFANSRHHVLAANGELTAAPADHPGRPRLFGGFAFSPEFVPDNTWSLFRPAHFVLPHFQFAEVAGERWLTINAVASVQEERAGAADNLQQALEAGYDLLRRHERERLPSANGYRQPRPATDIHYPMSLAQWSKMITDAQHDMTAGLLDKVVLSRVAEWRGRRSVDPLRVLQQLGSDYANCYRFLIEPARGQFFLGATPELLVSLLGDTVHSMALAGSARRGRTAAEDAVLASGLLSSAKDRHEHQLVVTAVRERLSTQCDLLTVPDVPGVLAFNTIQHLCTPVVGRLRDGTRTDILSLVELLHPTPALGGLPVPQALAFLTSAEPVPRGWYAAPIGWLDHRLDGAFAVAIRSAVCHHERAWLYAGAGIVPDSHPQREWDETELKFEVMLSAIAAEA